VVLVVSLARSNALIKETQKGNSLILLRPTHRAAQFAGKCVGRHQS